MGPTTLNQPTILTRSFPTPTATPWPTTTPRLCSALVRVATEQATCKDPTLSTCLMVVSSMSPTTPMATKVLWLKSPTRERLTTPLPQNTTPLHPSTTPLHLPITPQLPNMFLPLFLRTKARNC